MKQENNIPKITIHKSELDFMSRCVLDYPNVETGGDFFGFWTKEGNPVVQFVIGPGKNTSRNSTSFYQDIEYLKECGKFLNGKYGLEHIGGWHSHHKLSLNHPSGGDINTMNNVLQSGRIEKFLISICNITSNSKVTINGFLFSNNNTNHYTECEWNVKEIISPIREAIQNSNINLFTEPVTKKASESQSKKETKEVAEKPELPVNSYWKTDAGKKMVKEMYISLNDRKDITNFEMVQKKDERIAFRFNYKGIVNEIVLPHEYPNKPIELSRKLPNNVFKNIEFPVTNKKNILSDFDLTLRYMEMKFKSLFRN